MKKIRLINESVNVKDSLILFLTDKFGKDNVSNLNYSQLPPVDQMVEGDRFDLGSFTDWRGAGWLKDATENTMVTVMVVRPSTMSVPVLELRIDTIFKNRDRDERYLMYKYTGSGWVYHLTYK